MTYEFKPSSATTVHKQVFVALAGTTGSGKTESAMRIARGIVGENGKFCVIDTEHGRALNKQSRYEFDHLDLQPPYSPENFAGAINAAIDAGYGCIVIDNFSHEWFGDGGCSDIQEAALERMSGGDVRKAERLTALAWKQPKQMHKKLMNRIVQVSVPLIFCLRAEPKIKFQKNPQNGKTEVVDAGWQPIAEKMFAYEMLMYALLMPENPGVPDQLKKLEPELEAIFPQGKQITEQCGERLRAWATNGNGNQPNLGDFEKRRDAMLKFFDKNGVTVDRFLAYVNKLAVEDLTSDDIDTLAQKAKDIKDGMPVDEAFPVIDDSLFAEERAAIAAEA